MIRSKEQTHVPFYIDDTLTEAELNEATAELHDLREEYGPWSD